MKRPKKDIFLRKDIYLVIATELFGYLFIRVLGVLFCFTDSKGKGKEKGRF